jgi:hypothetical protein
MEVVALIKALFLVLIEYIKLRSKSFYYDIRIKSRQEQQEIINEIEKLRTSKLSSDHARADLLRVDLQREREFIKHISATYTTPQSGSTD